MDRESSGLTVFFEDPFWVGVFEIRKDNMVRAARHVFGAEPTGREILEFVKNHFSDLKFSPAVSDAVRTEAKNFKRAQREARKQISKTGTGTKSQEALKLQHEQFKSEAKKNLREQKVLKAKQKFELRQQKKKEKLRGK